MKKNITYNLYRPMVMLFTAWAAVLAPGCKKLLEIDPPKDKISSATVFSTDELATGAVSGIYTSVGTASLGFLSGATTAYPGLASDELNVTNLNNSDNVQFQNNSIVPQNGNLTIPLWYGAYNLIYQANACIEGISTSPTISQATKDQLLGECKFIRALNYFYLTNLYGDVPLVTGTYFEENAAIARTPSASVQAQILGDLLDARAMLKPAYPVPGVLRANKWAATALLARVYLYQKKYDLAEEMATEVISSGAYQLEGDPANVFLIPSRETILHIQHTFTGFNTTEGSTFVPSTSATTLPAYILSPGLLAAFAPTDKRLSAWTGTKTVSAVKYTYPFKYKKRSDFVTFSRTENFVVLRLGEQYLIRAEARANQNKVLGAGGAEADLNAIRSRAGLLPTTAANKTDMLLAIEAERRLEFFAEWGHRWFDLKRTGRADAVLSVAKGTNWQSTDQLFPLSTTTLNTNPMLTQNPGY